MENIQFWRLANPEQFSEPALHTHDNHGLCIVAILLAILAAYVLLPVTDRYHESKGRYRYLWLIAGSIAMGIGIWAMHFTAMLAFSLNVPFHYDVLITVISILPATLASGSCILMYKSAQTSIKTLHLTALSMAAGIGTMHYIGMEALIVSAEMYYIPSYFFLSIIACYLLAYTGLYARIHLINSVRWSPIYGTLVGSVILGLAVSCMHFIAMRATYFQPLYENVNITQHSIPPVGLIFGIIVVTVILIGLTIIGSIVDRQMDTMSVSLKQSELRFQRLAETTHTAIFTFDNEKINYANPALSMITGYSEDKIINNSLSNIVGEQFSEFANNILDSNPPFGQPHYEQFEIETSDGDRRWLYFSVTLTEIDNEPVGLASAFDISEQKNAELSMRHLAYSDQLTQIGNRMMFIDRLQHHLDLLKRREHKHFSCVMLLDLDKFKSINDTYGHLKGDLLLVDVSKRLKDLARNVDTVARLGGDEFVLLLEDLDSSISISIIADRIIEALSKPYDLNGRKIVINSSIGVVELNSRYEKPDQVLHDVDIAMYRAKKEPEACWVSFDQKLDSKVKRARQLLAELKTAIYENQLELYYQPIVASDRYQLDGFEALARWQRTNGEWVSPVEFIPLAEDSGLIADIGLWALETACQQLAIWNEEKHNKKLYVSVNVAAVSFNDDRFNKKIIEMIDKYQFKQGQIKLELTERIIVEDSGKMLDKLNKLIELGCELMLDDFGTGYSSLSYLYRLPIQTLKIDRAFIASIDDAESSIPIIKSILALAESLDMNVVSEGIETEIQAMRLASMGSDQLQGYLFSKPIAAEEAKKFLLNEGYQKLIEKKV